MPRRTGASISFNAPAPRNTSNDMNFTFQSPGAPTDGNYWAINGANAGNGAPPQLVANQNTIVMNGPGVLSTMYIETNANASDGNNRFRVIKNDSPTAITANVALGAHLAQDLTHSVGVLKGDHLSIEFTQGGNADFGGILGMLSFIPS